MKLFKIFIQACVPAKTVDQLKEKECKMQLPSLRKSINEDEQFNLFRVTPEFRNYVAKHLSAFLEKDLQKVLHQVQTEQVSHKKKHNCGIKLFKTSTVKIKKFEADDIDQSKIPQRFALKKNAINVNKDDLKQIAISGEEILKGKGTEHWSKRVKRKPFVYQKEKNGTLVNVSDNLSI